MTADEIIAALRAASDPARLPGMARVGIRIDDALGVPVPTIRRIARRAGTDHPLAVQLWATGVHEARMVAALVADPAVFSASAMTAWAGALNSWDVTDMLADTFAASPLADRMIRTWSRARHGFTKRCAFAMIARLAVSRADEPDDVFVGFLPLIRSAASDERNEVKKGVNWALRQIGKRNRVLRRAAIEEAEALLALEDRTARWIARDALRELRAPATVARIRG
jgi:3-methyladenine DNA glycosylase AlkD